MPLPSSIAVEGSGTTRVSIVAVQASALYSVPLLMSKRHWELASVGSSGPTIGGTVSWNVAETPVPEFVVPGNPSSASDPLNERPRLSSSPFCSER